MCQSKKCLPEKGGRTRGAPVSLQSAPEETALGFTGGSAVKRFGWGKRTGRVIQLMITVVACPSIAWSDLTITFRDDGGGNTAVQVAGTALFGGSVPSEGGGAASSMVSSKGGSGIYMRRRSPGTHFSFSSFSGVSTNNFVSTTSGFLNSTLSPLPALSSYSLLLGGAGRSASLYVYHTAPSGPGLVALTDSFNSNIVFSSFIPGTYTWGNPDGVAGDGITLLILPLLPSGPSDAVITSTLTSGVSVPNVAQSILTTAPQTALGTVNNRLFHARSQPGNPRGNGHSVVSSSRRNSSFFHFGREQGLTLAQVLGFEDIPVTAEVAESGTSFVIKGLTIETQIGLSMAADTEPWEIYTSGDYLSFDQNPIGPVQPGFNSDTFTGTVGAEYRVNENLNIGLAYSYLNNRTKLGNNFGRVNVEGSLVSTYATYFWDDNYVDVLYSRAYFDNSLMRNVPGGTAIGTPEFIADIVNVNLGKNIDLGKGLVTGPLAGLDYTHGEIDAYTEVGPTAAILAYQARSYESLITRLGWQTSKMQEVTYGRLTLQGSLAWEKQHMPEADTVNAALVAFPALPFNLNAGANPGTDWLSLGVGASLLTRSGAEFQLNYQSQLFRQDVTSHYVGARVSVKF